MKMNILILDDDQIGNMLLSTVLSDNEQITTFHIETNGWEALQYLQKVTETGTFPNLVLVDLKMPEMDGFEFITHYEAKFYQQFPETKLAVLTSSVREKERREALNHISVIDFISKPLSEEKLTELSNLVSR